LVIAVVLIPSRILYLKYFKTKMEARKIRKNKEKEDYKIRMEARRQEYMRKQRKQAEERKQQVEKK